MNFDIFINKLENAEKFSSIENAYSHIVSDIFDMVLESSYYLLDVSSWKRIESNKTLLPKNIMAVPDFIITKKTMYHDLNNCRFGCVEVKFNDYDVEKPTRLYDLGEEKGYLNVYNYVIYTNGWKWICYRNAKVNNNIKIWECNFRINKNNNEYGKLLYNLCTMNWDSKPEINNDVI